MTDEQAWIESRRCRHCGTINQVARCEECDREYVVTVAHVEGRLRTYDDPGLLMAPENYGPLICDFCSARRMGLSVQAVDAGLRQATCPTCHTEFLSDPDAAN